MRIIDADVLLAEFDRREAEPEYQHEGEDWYCGLISGEELVMEAPTIETEQRWIPVTDHLPDEDVPVLVTDDAGGMATVGIDSCGRYEDTGERFWYTSQNVTAWMYTVEPYGGEQDEQMEI